MDDKALIEQKLTITFADTKVILKLGPGGRGSEYAYELDPDKRPKRLVIRFRQEDKDVSWPSIYELGGDELRMCLGVPGTKEFPGGFDGERLKPNKDTQTLFLKRQAQAKGPGAKAAWELSQLLEENRANMDQLQAQRKLLDAQLDQLRAQQAVLEADRAGLEAQLEQTKALLDARDALEQATTGQSPDRALKTLDQIEKLIQQMKKALKEKEDRK